MAGWLDALLDAIDGLGRQLARGLSFRSPADVEARDLRLAIPPDRASVGLADRLSSLSSGIDAARCVTCGASLAPLDPAAEDRGPISGCPEGCGLLVSGPALRRLERDPGSGSEVAAAAEPDAGAPAFETVRYRRCPVCRGWMQRTNYMRVSGVMVDFCSSHGLWLDRGELTAIVSFLAGGGARRAVAFEETSRAYVRWLRATTPETDWPGES